MWLKLFLFVIFNFELGFAQHLNDVKSIAPNIIIFLSDDHSAEDVGYIGNRDVSTPVIDKLASEGMIFTRAFASASVCSPSRSSIYTGLFPHRHGCDSNSGSIRVDEKIKTLPEYFKDQGYRVGLAGKVHVKPKESFPFEYIERNEIPLFLDSARDKPFCLIIAYNNPHEPFFNKKKGVDFKSIDAKDWLPSTSETEKLVAGYYDNVENLDNEIGASLYWLEKAGVLQNAIQVYTSDHGSGLPFAKWTLYEQGLHVPFIIKWKGVIKPGTQSDGLISLVDLLPTLLEMTGSSEGIYNLDDMDGKSFLPVLTSKKLKYREYIYAAYTNLGVKDGNKYPIRSIRDERYKLIINFNYREPFTIRMNTRPDDRSIIGGYRAIESWQDIMKSNAFAAKRYHEFSYRPHFELYDLNIDPFELDNLIINKNYHKVLQKLINKIKEWMSQQNDPLYSNM